MKVYRLNFHTPRARMCMYRTFQSFKILFTYFESILPPSEADTLHPNQRHRLRAERQCGIHDHRVAHCSPSTVRSNPLKIPQTGNVHLHSTIHVAILLQQQTL